MNRAAFGGETTYVTCDRGHRPAAAIVPADLVAAYESLIDREDGAIAARPRWGERALRTLRGLAHDSIRGPGPLVVCGRLAAICVFMAARAARLTRPALAFNPTSRMTFTACRMGSGGERPGARLNRTI